MDTLQLVLASASPRRHRLLKAAGIPHVVRPTNVKEVYYDDRPSATALENTRGKLTAAIAQNPGCAIIAADTVLDFEGRCLAKPADIEEAHRMLQSLSAKTHRVITATGLSHPHATPLIDTTVTIVKFRSLSYDTIRQYCLAVNPLDRAGGYDISEHGKILLDSFEGSWTNIIGLPMEKITVWWNA